MLFNFFISSVFIAMFLFLGYMSLTPAMLYKFRTRKDFASMGAEYIPKIMAAWKEAVDLRVANSAPELDQEIAKRSWKEFKSRCTFDWTGLYSQDRIGAPINIYEMAETKNLALAIAYANKAGLDLDMLGITDKIVGEKLFNIGFRSAYNLANGLTINTDVNSRDFFRYRQITKFLGIDPLLLLGRRTKSLYTETVA